MLLGCHRDGAILVVEEDVCWFEVTVNEALLVHVLQPAKDLVEVVQHSHVVHALVPKQHERRKRRSERLRGAHF